MLAGACSQCTQEKTFHPINCDQRACIIAAEIEFLSKVDKDLNDGEILTMAELQNAFENIMAENNVDDHSCSRKILKQLIQKKIPGIEFYRPVKVNESERVTIKRTRDEAIQQSEGSNVDLCNDDMKTIFNAAILLRKSINRCKKWVFTGSLDNLSHEHVPPQLYSFCRWVIRGSNDQVCEVEEKTEIIHKRATSLSQTVVSQCLTDSQIRNKRSKDIKSTRVMPQQLAVGLAFRKAIRSKEIVSMLHGFGMSVEYNRLLRVEAQIEESAINRIQEKDGVYLPPDFVKNRYLFLQLIMLISPRIHLMASVHFMVRLWPYIKKLRMTTEFLK